MDPTAVDVDISLKSSAAYFPKGVKANPALSAGSLSEVYLRLGKSSGDEGSFPAVRPFNFLITL